MRSSITTQEENTVMISTPMYIFFLTILKSPSFLESVIEFVIQWDIPSPATKIAVMLLDRARCAAINSKVGSWQATIYMIWNARASRYEVITIDNTTLMKSTHPLAALMLHSIQVSLVGYHSTM